MDVIEELELMKQWQYRNEVISPEQMAFEDQGWYFRFNIPEIPESMEGLKKVKEYAEGFRYWRIGMGYDCNGNVVDGFSAFYIMP